MTRFKDFASNLNRDSLDNPSVKVTLKSTGHTLFLKFDTKDILTNAKYLGPADPWLGSLCSIAVGKTLFDLSNADQNFWDKSFQQDQTFWDLKNEKIHQFFFPALELLNACIESYRGKEYLFKEAEPLICRCFGVRENDVLEYVRTTNDPTPEGLATFCKAGMGCRSCVPQLTKWLSIHTPKTEGRYYKEKPRAHWLLEIDYMLSCFPEALDWKMEVKSFHGTQVTIEFDKEVSQREEEETANRLQDFLSAALDSDLSFFLIRSRHLSKA